MIKHLLAVLSTVLSLFDRLFTRLDEERYRRQGEDRLKAAQAEQAAKQSERVRQVREAQRVADRSRTDPRLHDDGFRRD